MAAAPGLSGVVFAVLLVVGWFASGGDAPDYAAADQEWTEWADDNQWQHTRGSALLGWVGDDAEFIAGEMEAAAGVATAGSKPANEDYERALTPEAAGAMEGV